MVEARAGILHPSHTPETLVLHVVYCGYMYSTSRRPKEAKPNANKCLSSNDLDLQQDKETDLKIFETFILFVGL